MRKRGFVIFFILLLGCNVLPITPEIPATSTNKTETSTVFSVNTNTPNPPTTTPFPELRTKGPYLYYFDNVDGRHELVILDADGAGRKTIAIPDSLIDSFRNLPEDLDIYHVSPDGKWLAFFTGSAGILGIPPSDSAYDLALKIFNFSTGEIRDIAFLLSTDYPNNFENAAKRLNDPSLTGDMLYQAFINGVTNSLEWSPDGRYLAFTGQMGDGLSSNLYIYEVKTGTIRHLSSGDQPIQSIDWSPDGKWVVYSGSYKVGMGMKFDNFACLVDGVSVKRVSASTSNFRMWASSHTYIEHDNENVYGSFGFRLVDISTGQIVKIWDGPVLSYGLNAEKSKFVFVTHLFSQSPYLDVQPDPDFVSGLYIMDLDTLAIVNIETSDSFNSSGSLFIEPFDLNNNLFALTSYGESERFYLLTDTGELTELNLYGMYRVIESPDAELWIGVKNSAVDVYSVDNTLINTVRLPFHDAQMALFIWQPDSKGLFVVNGSNIYSIDISTGKVNLIEFNLMRDFFGFGVRWIIEN